jgi:endonuclease/exonuclease/phosphatase family metal-dependent hydrolase
MAQRKPKRATRKGALRRRLSEVSASKDLPAGLHRAIARVSDWRSRPANQPVIPHLCLLRAPAVPVSSKIVGSMVTVATYNVHRWTGMNGRRRPDPARAGFVISEIDADVIALQEVIRPFTGDDPLASLAEALGLHVAFAVTRIHKRGQLGNAILSRFPISAISVLDISHSRLERRVVLASQFEAEEGDRFGVVATHLSLVDRTRRRQVESLLEHPQLQSGPVVMLGDMNAWRECPATRKLDEHLGKHNNEEWPASFPAPRPMLALDRIYASGAKVLEVYSHDTPAARKASDHLPVVAEVQLISSAREPAGES